MPITLAGLHALMARECGGQAGLFVPISGTTQLLRVALEQCMTNLPKAGGLPSPAKDVAVTPVAVNPQHLVVALTQDQASGVISVDVQPFTLDLAVHVAQKSKSQFSTVRLLFEELSLGLDAQAGRIRLKLKRVRGEGAVVLHPGRDALLKTLGWSPDQVETLNRFENYLAFGGRGIVAQLILDAAAFPPIIESFVGLQFEGPLRLSVEQDQELGSGLLITAANGAGIKRPRCTNANSASEFDVALKPGGSASGFAFAFTQHPRVNPPTGLDPIEPPSLEGRFGVFVYLPKDILDVSFGPAAFPAIYVSGGGGWGSAQYEWSLSIALKQLALAIAQGAAEVAVAAPLTFDGTVSAWINLPCDGRLDLGSVRLRGDIDPLVIAIRVLYDKPSMRILFDGELRQCSVGKIAATVNTPLPWPVDDILERVIAHNAPGMIWTALYGALDQMRFELATMARIQQQIPLPFDTALYHALPGSLVYGLAARG